MDKYRKVKTVGKGSFGYAVLVQNIADRKFYIMKVIDVSKMDRKQKEEALNEVHVLKAMRHPYIITYHESFMDKKCLCIVMDYADGGDMYNRIAKQKNAGRGGFSENQLLDWFVQICLALKHVHDRKILHRDLKTQNIFLTSRGEIKIGDFGIARVLQHTYDCAQTAIGTPYYLSPEICQEKPYNQKSDIWSLGCILYEMTTLRHAFDASNMKELVIKILRGTYPPVPSTYSQGLRDLIADMLEKDAHKRPSIRRILEREFLSSRVTHLLSLTLAKSELGQSSLVRQLQDLTPGEASKENSRATEHRKRESEDIRLKPVNEYDRRGRASEDACIPTERDARENPMHYFSFHAEGKSPLKPRNAVPKAEVPKVVAVAPPRPEVRPVVDASGYEDVVKSLQQCLERRAEDDEDFEEDETQQVKAK